MIYALPQLKLLWILACLAKINVTHAGGGSSKEAEILPAPPSHSIAVPSIVVPLSSSYALQNPSFQETPHYELKAHLLKEGARDEEANEILQRAQDIFEKNKALTPEKQSHMIESWHAWLDSQESNQHSSTSKYVVTANPEERQAWYTHTVESLQSVASLVSDLATHERLLRFLLISVQFSLAGHSSLAHAVFQFSLSEGGVFCFTRFSRALTDFFHLNPETFTVGVQKEIFNLGHFLMSGQANAFQDMTDVKQAAQAILATQTT